MSVLMIEQLKQVMIENRYPVLGEKVLNDGMQLQLSTKNGLKVNFFPTKGTINVQGKNCQEKDFLDQLLKETALNGEVIDIQRRKVFIVHGHDQSSLDTLERILRKWNLEPVILSQQPNDGLTLIEKLEKYASEVSCGIVLVTPDDIGYKNGFEAVKKSRARQNVIFEFGLLVGKLGRNKIVVLRRKQDDFEFLSDVNGVVYILFEHLESSALEIYRNLKNLVHIDANRL